AGMSVERYAHIEVLLLPASLAPSTFGFPVARMTLVGPGDGKFAELMPHHVLGDEHRHMLPSVMDGNGQSDHVGQHHGAARPGLDRSTVVRLGCRRHLLCKVRIDKWSFSNGTWHVSNSSIASLKGVACFATSSCDGERSSGPFACSRASCIPWTACPTGLPGVVHRRSCLRRRRADGRPGSSPHRVLSVVLLSSASHRPCRAFAGCVRRVRLRPPSRGIRRGYVVLRRSAVAPWHTPLHAPRSARRNPRSERAGRPCPASALRNAPWCLQECS